MSNTLVFYRILLFKSSRLKYSQFLSVIKKKLIKTLQRIITCNYRIVFLGFFHNLENVKKKINKIKILK